MARTKKRTNRRRPMKRDLKQRSHRNRLHLEQLEDRRLLALLVSYTGGATDFLELQEQAASPSADNVTVWSPSATELRIDLNGAFFANVTNPDDTVLTFSPDNVDPSNSMMVTIDLGDLKELSIKTVAQGDTVTLDNLSASGVATTLDLGTGANIANVDGATALDNLAISSGAAPAGVAITLDGSVTTDKDQTYSGPVTLAQDVVLTVTDTTNAAQFNDDVDGTTAGTEFLAVLGNLQLGDGVGNDLIGSAVSLEFLTVSKTTRIATTASPGDATIETKGDQTYAGPVVLEQDTVLRVNNASNAVRFRDKVDGLTAAQQSLTIEGNLLLGDGAGDYIGSVQRLEFLDISGTAQIAASLAAPADTTIETEGAQTYGGIVTLAEDTVLRVAGSAGQVLFSDAVKGTTAGQESLTVNAAPGQTTFAGSLYADTLEFGGGDVAFQQDVGDNGASKLEALIIAGGSGAAPCGFELSSNITTSGDLVFGASVCLTADVKLTSTTSGVTFESTVNGTTSGTETLEVDAPGATTLGGNVGDVTPLKKLETDAAGTTVIDTTLVKVNGSTITFKDDVILAENVTIKELGAGAVTFEKTVKSEATKKYGLTIETLAGTTAVVAPINAESVEFGGGHVTFTGAVGDGGAGKLGALKVTGTGGGGTNRLDLDAAVTTDTGQTYNAPVRLTTDVTLTETGAGKILFTETVVSESGETNNLDINAAGGTTIVGASVFAQSVVFGGGNVEFQKDVGNATTVRLGALDVSGPSGGTDLGGDVDTEGDQTYQKPVVVTINQVTLTADSTGTGAVTFQGTVKSEANETNNLTINAVGGTTVVANAVHAESVDFGGGKVDFQQAVGGATNATGRLGALTVAGGAGAATHGLDLGASVTTDMGQSYNTPVRLTENVTLTENGAGKILFTETVVSESGETNNLVIDAAGGTTIVGAAIEAESLVLGGGNVEFQQAVGDSTTGRLGLLSVTTSGTVGSCAIALGSNITTVNEQIYNKGVCLTADVTLTSTTSGVTFESTVNGTTSGTETLEVDAPGATTFGGVVGDVTPLERLTTDTAGTTVIDTTLVKVNGSTITFKDDVILEENVTIKELGSGAVTFEKTVKSEAGMNYGLTIEAAAGTTQVGSGVFAQSVEFGGGEVEFAGVVGDATTGRLGALMVTGGTTAPGAIGLDLNGNIDTDDAGAGNQIYDTPARLTANVALNQFAAGTGKILFTETVVSNGAPARNLDINAAGGTTIVGASVFATSVDFGGGNVEFQKTVGDATTGRLGTLDVSGPSGTLELRADVDTNVASAGNQTYNAPVVLAADVTLTQYPTGSGTIQFNSTVMSDVLQTRKLDIVAAEGTTQVEADIYATSVEFNGGDVVFKGNVGDNGDHRLGVLTVTGGKVAADLYGLELGGAAAITIDTDGDQVYNTPVLLVQDAALNAAGVTYSPAGSVTFNATVDGTRKLTITSDDVTEFATNVGKTTPLQELTVTAGKAFDFDAEMLVNQDIRIKVNENSYVSENLDHIYIRSGAKVQTLTTGSVTFEAGDNIWIEGAPGGGSTLNAATVTAAGNLMLAGDVDTNDAYGTIIDVVGVRFNPPIDIDGRVTAGGRIDFVGGPDNDRFNIQFERLAPNGAHYVDGKGHKDASYSGNSVIKPTVVPDPPYTARPALTPVATNKPTGDVLNVTDADRTDAQRYRIDANSVERDGPQGGPKGPILHLETETVGPDTVNSLETLNLTTGSGEDLILIAMPEAGSVDLPTFVNLDGGDPVMPLPTTPGNPPSADQLFILGTDRAEENLTVNAVLQDNLPLGSKPNGRGGSGPFAMVNIEILNIDAQKGRDILANYANATSLMRSIGDNGLNESQARAESDIFVGGNAPLLNPGAADNRVPFDVMFGSSGFDAMWGNEGDDYLFSDLQATNVASGSELFEDRIQDGDYLNGGPGRDKIVSRGTDIVSQCGSSDALVVNGAEIDVLCWLRAQFVAQGSNEANAFPGEALDKFRAAGGKTTWPGFLNPPENEPEGSSLQNSEFPVDVNGDGRLSPLDALLIINELNRVGPHAVPPIGGDGEGETATPYFLDTNGDNYVSAIDALIVINALNRGGEGEGESAIVESNLLDATQDLPGHAGADLASLGDPAAQLSASAGTSAATPGNAADPIATVAEPIRVDPARRVISGSPGGTPSIPREAVDWEQIEEALDDLSGDVLDEDLLAILAE